MTISQAHYHVVTRLIQPLSVMFGGIPEERARIYCEKLSSFRNEALEAAYNDLIESWIGRGFPPLPKIIESCRRYAEKAATPEATSRALEEYQNTTHFTKEAFSFLKTELGQYALKNLVGHCCWVWVMRHGEINQHDVEAQISHQNKNRAWANSARNNPKRDAGTNRLLGLFDAMETKQEEWAKKYLRGGDKPAMQPPSQYFEELL